MFKALLSMLIVIMSSSAYAGIVEQYYVASTTIKECGNASFGLWTNTFQTGSTKADCSAYFDLDSSKTTWTRYSRGYASLKGEGKNAEGKMVTIDLIFDGITDIFLNSLTGGGDIKPDWRYYLRARGTS